MSCADTIGVDGAGLSLTRDGGPEPVFGTDNIAEALEQAQFTTGEGPCVDAISFGVPVLVADLERLWDGHVGRWPVFASEALDLGVRAIFALPLRIGAASFGASDLYRRTAGPLDGRDLSRALATMDAVALTMLGVGEMGEGGDAVDDPAPLMNLEVHRAAGMVMVQLSVSIQQALTRLRATAFAEGIAIEVLARDVVSRRRRFEETQQ